MYVLVARNNNEFAKAKYFGLFAQKTLALAVVEDFKEEYDEFILFEEVERLHMEDSE